MLSTNTSDEQLSLPGIGDMVLGTPHRSVPANQPRPFDAVLGFRPSTYQRAIFDWLSSGTGSCVVSAVPGSGKTTTLVKGAAYIPKSLRSRFLAFNKHIAEELGTRLPKHIKASTIHSLGLASLCRRFHGMPDIDKRKYSDIVRDYLVNRKAYSPLEYRRLVALVKFTQLTLTDVSSKEALKQLCHYYGLPTFGDWDFIGAAVTEVLNKGVKLAGEIISYEDMVWLPSSLDLPVASYDFLCVDEAQDLNKAQLELVMRAHKSGARGIYVGDHHQAIMGFSASDTRSLTNIIDRVGATQLPLSICYRCPASHIELANQIYNVIVPRPQAPTGTVSTIGISKIPSLVRGGDLIICRCLYPLISVYYDLLKAGIPSRIKNKDIASQLLNLLEQIVASDRDYSPSEFTDVLVAWYEQRKKEMLDDEIPLLVIVNLHDRIRTLNAIYSGNHCQDTGELKTAIANLSAPSIDAVNLTTIHGGKGLEAMRVFFLRPDLVPHPKAEKDWEKEQEKNLEFVALTRAKQDLFFAR